MTYQDIMAKLLFEHKVYEILDYDLDSRYDGIARQLLVAQVLDWVVAE